MIRRVLVLEDESLVAILLEDLLTDLGCEVVGPAASIREALRLADLGGIDFALLDVNLGGEARSFEVAERLRAAGTPFAFVTGYGRDGVRADLRDAPVLTKPVDATALARALGV